VQVSGVATHINQSLRRQVDTLKLLELQNCFFPPVILVEPGRRLIKKVSREGSRSGAFFFKDNVHLKFSAWQHCLWTV
jgi:hypothetical protein